MLLSGCFFFFKQKTAYEWRISDWSSDVCSSDLVYAFNPSDNERLLLAVAEDTVHVTQLAINHLQSVESCPPRVCGIGLEGRLSGVDQSISLNVRLRHSLLKFPVVCRDSDRKSTRLNSSH